MMRAAVDSGAQGGQGLFVLALAVKAFQRQRYLVGAQLHAPRALTRSTAQFRLRYTASPALAVGPLRPSTMASRRRGGGLAPGQGCS